MFKFMAGVVICTFLTTVELFGVDFNVTKGWNLFGTTEGISSLTSLKYQGINIIWLFNKENKKWEVYAPEYNGTLPYKTINSIPPKSGFWAFSKEDKNATTNMCNLNLKSLGFFIRYTYCSYSDDDIGRFWGTDEGFFNISKDEKNKKAKELENKYIYCGIYQKEKIENLGAQSPCYEANVYWSK